MPGESELLALAVAEHNAGNLERAEQVCRDLVARDPRQAKAWKLLGVLARDSGRVAQAIDYLQAALECTGPDPRLYFHLGLTHSVAGQLDAAIRCFGQSLTLAEGEPKVHRALAMALAARGNRNEALHHFRRSLELDPTHVETHFRLAVTLAANSQAAAAEQEYGRLLEKSPDHASAWSNLGTLLQEQGRPDEAKGSYRRAIACDVQCVQAHFNLGTVLLLGGDFDESAATFERVTRIRPDFAEAHIRLGDALAAQGKLDAARLQIGRAAALRANRLVWALRADLVGERIFASHADIDAYRLGLTQRIAELSASSWDLDLTDVQAAGSPPPAALAYQGRDDRPLKTAFANLFAGRLPVTEHRRRSGKPRVGFVVTPGHEGIFLRGMAGVLNRLDTQELEIVLTHGAAAENLVAGQIETSRVECVVLSPDLARAAGTLRQGRFDLLYYWEIGTDPLNYFLPFLGPAPVQCASWGWPVTSGIPQVDYFLSWDPLESASDVQHYSERLVRLKHMPNYYHRPNLTGVVADRSRFGFAAAENVYLCVQNPRKFHPDFDPLIGAILRGDSSSVFVMLEASPAHLTDQLRARFARSLPDVVGRIRILPRMTKADFYQLLASADVVLDTPHYGGGANTTYDTLALGKPC